MVKAVASLGQSFDAILSDLIEYPQTGFISKIILRDNNSQYNLFCLAKHTEIEEHISTRNATITVIEGKGNLILAGKNILLTPGVFVFLPANTSHSLQSEENLAFILTLSENCQPKTKVKEKTIEIVKSTAPVLKQHGQEITKRMYEIMFEKYPEVKLQFNMSDQANGSQHSRLATAVYSYATHIDDLDALKAMVNKIAHRHVQSYVLPEQYPIVGECLLQAIKDILKEAATEEIMTAWTEAYQLLAEVFINREQEIYNS